MKKIFLLLSIVLILAGCGSQGGVASSAYDQGVSEKQAYHNYVDIKYREDSVDLADARFEYLNTSESSFVNGAWYDNSNLYMVINLSGTYYHYCGMPVGTWSSFGSADSFGTYYNKYIKGNYDCRNNPVPEY